MRDASTPSLRSRRPLLCWMLLLLGMLPAFAVTPPGFSQSNLLETVCPACGKSLPNMATAHACNPTASRNCAEAVAFLKQVPGSGFSPDTIDSLAREGACEMLIQLANDLRDAQSARAEQVRAQEIQRGKDAQHAKNRELAEKRRRELEALDRNKEEKLREIEQDAARHVERKRESQERWLHGLELLKGFMKIYPPSTAFGRPSAVYGGVKPLEVAQSNFNGIYTDEVRQALAKPIEYAGNGIQDVFAKGFGSIEQSDDVRMGGGYPSRQPGSPAPRSFDHPAEQPGRDEISPNELPVYLTGFEIPVPKFPPSENADETVEDELRNNQLEKVDSGATRPAASTTRNGPPEPNGTQKALATTKPATQPSPNVVRLRDRLRAIPTRP